MTENYVVVLDAPMSSATLCEMNSGGWGLLQVVVEKFEVGRDHTEHFKIFYGYRYHHYFTR